MAGDFRFSQVGKNPEHPYGGNPTPTGVANAFGGVANAITARLNARTMAHAAETQALAHAYGVVHTNETEIKLETMRNEATLTDNAAQREHEAKMAREGRLTIRAQGEADRKAIASRAVAEQGAGAYFADYAAEQADKGHTIDITHSLDKGTRIQLTPASAREPESEADL